MAEVRQTGAECSGSEWLRECAAEHLELCRPLHRLEACFAVLLQQAQLRRACRLSDVHGLYKLAVGGAAKNLRCLLRYGCESRYFSRAQGRFKCQRQVGELPGKVLAESKHR